ncbi:MAG: hypothetical protein IJM09_05125, partial [Neisseriaceae bacterium]|nr:hypothetical protein [Neisseriaceae bacterium]
MNTNKLFQFSLITSAVLSAIPAMSMAGDVYEVRRINEAGTHPGQGYYSLSKNGGAWGDFYDFSVSGPNGLVAAPNGNTINIYGTDTQMSQAVYGGYSNNDSVVENNAVHFDALDEYGGMSGTVYGGASVNSVVQNNTVRVQGGLHYSSDRFYGGYSEYGSVQGNIVNINDATHGEIKLGTPKVATTVGAGAVYGGSNYRNNAGEVRDNVVNYQNSSSAGKIYGGHALGKSVTVTSNQVTIDNGKLIGEVYGGWTDSENAIATENKVEIKNGDGIAQIWGGRSAKASADHNTVIIHQLTNNDAIPTEYVVGGGGQLTANGNQVNIANANIGTVYGGSSGVDANDNMITINSGTISDVYGGYATYSATHNIVNFNGGEITGTIYGGHYANDPTDKPFDRLTGNTLNIGSNQQAIAMNTLKAGNIANFEQINFYLPNTVKNGETALQLTGNGKTDLSKTTVLAYLDNAKGLTADSKIHLIQTNGTLTQPKNNDVKQDNVKVSIAGLINVIGQVKLTDSKNLDLTFTTDNSGSTGGSSTGTGTGSNTGSGSGSNTGSGSATGGS